MYILEDAIEHAQLDTTFSLPSTCHLTSDHLVLLSLSLLLLSCIGLLIFTGPSLVPLPSLRRGVMPKRLFLVRMLGAPC